MLSDLLVILANLHTSLRELKALLKREVLLFQGPSGLASQTESEAKWCSSMASA